MQNIGRHYLMGNPRYTTVGQLFQDGALYEVPKYQRAYAWQPEHVDDFLKDIDRCNQAREASDRREHFFGGLVCVEAELAGTGIRRRELIDGQQRIATFVLFAARLIARCQELAEEARDAGEEDIRAACEARAGLLREQFLTKKGMQHLKPVELPKVTLSPADRDFFGRLIENEHPKLLRASHELLLAASKLVDRYLFHLLDGLSRNKQVNAIEPLIAIINDDCSVIYIPSKSRSDAYRLFQVLNDRGETLSAGDLLRAATLELLEGEPLVKEQRKAEEHWNGILVDPPQSSGGVSSMVLCCREGAKSPSHSTLR